MPSFSAASNRAWPAMMSSSAPTKIGLVHPHSRIDAAILATCSRLWVRGLLTPRNQTFDWPALDLYIDVRCRDCWLARHLISLASTYIMPGNTI